MEIGDVLNAMLIKITSWFAMVFGYLKDYYKEFIRSPKDFLSEHTIVVILALFIIVLIGVIVFNIIRNIQDKRIIKKQVLAKYLEDEKKAKEEIAKQEKIEEVNDEEEFKKLVEAISNEETSELEIIEKNLEPIKEETEEIKVQEDIVEAPIEEKEEVKTVIEPITEEITVSNEPKEEFYVDTKRPIPNNILEKEPIIPNIENEILDIEFESKEEIKEEEKSIEPISFDPIPELRVLDKENVDTMEEIISEEPEPIVMEKIEVVRLSSVKKYGAENFDTNREGRTFTYEELRKLIKD